MGLWAECEYIKLHDKAQSQKETNTRFLPE